MFPSLQYTMFTSQTVMGTHLIPNSTRTNGSGSAKSSLKQKSISMQYSMKLLETRKQLVKRIKLKPILVRNMSNANKTIGTTKSSILMTSSFKTGNVLIQQLLNKRKLPIDNPNNFQSLISQNVSD